MGSNFPKSNEDNAQIFDFREIGFKAKIILGYNYSAQANPPLPPHKHPDGFEIILFNEGMQPFRVEDKEFITMGGDILVLLPGQTHSSAGSPKTIGSVHWLEFESLSDENNFFTLPEAANRALQEKLMHIPRLFFKGGSEPRLTLKKLMKLCCEPITALWEVEVKHLILRFLFDIISQAEEPADISYTSKPINEAMHYIKENLYDLSPQVPKLASMVGLSESRFQTRFLKEVGMTPVNYINTLKVERAKELLCDPANSIIDISTRLGFNSSQYFATVFKRMTNMTPSQWMKDQSGTSECALP